MGCPGAPRGRGRSPETVFQKSIKTVEIHAFLTKPATQQIQWGRAGPRVHNADSCALLRHTSETIVKTKENEGLLCGFGMPPWDVREGIRGDRKPVRVSQKTVQNSGNSCISGKTRYAANSLGPSAPGPLWTPYPFATDRGRGATQSAHAQNHWKYKGKHWFPRRRPKTPLMYSRLQQGSPGTSITL